MGLRGTCCLAEVSRFVIAGLLQHESSFFFSPPASAGRSSVLLRSGIFQERGGRTYAPTVSRTHERTNEHGYSPCSFVRSCAATSRNAPAFCCSVCGRSVPVTGRRRLFRRKRAGPYKVPPSLFAGVPTPRRYRCRLSAACPARRPEPVRRRRTSWCRSPNPT